MSTPDRIQQSARPVQGAPPARTAATDTASGAAFKALLEKLEEQSRRLEAASEGVTDARELAGAVGRAGESVHEVMQLGDQLLEAYRAARQRSETGANERD